VVRSFGEVTTRGSLQNSRDRGRRKKCGGEEQKKSERSKGVDEKKRGPKKILSSRGEGMAAAISKNNEGLWESKRCFPEKNPRPKGVEKTRGTGNLASWGWSKGEGRNSICC